MTAYNMLIGAAQQGGIASEKNAEALAIFPNMPWRTDSIPQT